MAIDSKHPSMSLQEKELYNQIHPAKLAVDIGSTPFSLYLYWQHELLIAVLITFIPAIVASAIIMKYVDLENYRSSRLGSYIKKNMSRAMEGVRFLGLFVMIFGAWFHILILIPLGLIIVLLAWLKGVVLSYLRK